MHKPPLKPEAKSQSAPAPEERQHQARLPAPGAAHHSAGLKGIGKKNDEASRRHREGIEKAGHQKTKNWEMRFKDLGQPHP